MFVEIMIVISTKKFVILLFVFKLEYYFVRNVRERKK